LQIFLKLFTFDYTCEDCGRRFYNERNKLQVHHLVYRDVNPWSYSPDELVVLCEDCHKKRHGLVSEPKQKKFSSQSHFEEIDKADSFSTNKYLRSESSAFNTDDFDYANSPYSFEQESGSGFKFKYLLLGLLLFICLIMGRKTLFYNQSENSNESSYENEIQSVENNANDIDLKSKRKAKNARKPSYVKNNSLPTDDHFSEENVLPEELEQSTITTAIQTEKTISEPVINKTSENTSNRELSTIELLERKNHADVVKQAKHAGVSTEGSTIDILERINHANVVKQAKRAGVSTEGSTIDILERINHANVVKQAKRAGVSTEGSTIDILERINRKELEKYNY